MPSRKTTRKLNVYLATAHTKNGQLDYSEFLKTVLDLPVAQRVIEEPDSVLYLDRAPSHRHLVGLKAYEGAPGQAPLIVDKVAGNSRLGDLTEEEFVAQPTRAVFNPRTTEFVIEYNHRGAKAKNIARALTNLLQTISGDSKADFEITAVADKGFFEALSDLRRIRVAAIKLAEPNIDWTDHYDAVSTLGDKSDAGSIQVTAFAKRQRSLSFKEGMVDFMKSALRKTSYPVKNARIEGNRKDDGSEAVISLHNHVEHRRVNVELTKSGQIRDSEISDHLIEYALDRERST